MNRRFSRIAYSLATTTLLLAACSDDPSSEGSARFASASLEQKQRALIAGSSADAAMGLALATFLSLEPEESTCPRVTRSGDTVTATHDCTDDDGNRLSGRIVAKNLPDLFGGGNDPTRPIEVTFEGYKAQGENPGENLAIDGSVIARPDGSMTAALRATLLGIEVVTDATWRPAGDELTADEGSTIEVTGLGLAEIAGRWSADEDAPSGALELRGADVLKADFARASGSCVPLTVDGKDAGQLCDK